ncbi:MAG: dihydroorotate dehydrogenase electron transfer subunit [Candidatus Cloacimonetes bacterium]|nr:dihydroorotate dehydrogenase electron transfer subunit [Candidatus Cloacimonadota bacterium]
MFYKVLQIVKKEVINNKYFIITFSNSDMADQCHPGQFFRLKNQQQNFPILPRPFSVYNIQDGKISFLIKIIGESTKNLFETKIGENISLHGPLGNGFKLVKNKKVLIVSGGIGYAPLNFLCDELKKADNEITFFHGGKGSDDIFSKIIKIFTEDGSIGEKGLVTDRLEEFLSQNQIDIVYACGPKIMMKKIYELCKIHNIGLQVSLEAIMACGVGSCCGCTIKIFNENNEIIYKKVCKDGPVFDGYTVVWDE